MRDIQGRKQKIHVADSKLYRSMRDKPVIQGRNKRFRIGTVKCKIPTHRTGEKEKTAQNIAKTFNNTKEEQDDKLFPNK